MIHFLIVAALATVPSSGGPSSGAPVAATEASWSSVKATGGADLGRAFKDAGQWYLPTGINFSGVKPGATTLNSGVTCASVKASHSSTTIYVTAMTTVALGQAACPVAKIGKAKAGTYSVVYRGAKEADQLLGQVTLGDGAPE